MSFPKSLVPHAVRALGLLSACLLAACLDPSIPIIVGPGPIGTTLDGGGGTPVGNGDGGLLQPSDGGTFAAKSTCPGGAAVCPGACPDAGSICLGNCGFLPSVRYPLAGDQVDLAVGDLQNDGFLDLVTADRRGNAIDVLFNRQGGLFQTPVLWGANQPQSLVLANLDGNNSLDVLLSNAGGSQLGVYLNQGTGAFGPFSTTQVGDSLGSVTTWLNNGTGQRFAAVLRAGAQDVAVLPVNANGVPEIGTATPGKVTSYPSPSGPNYLVAADFNGDGRADLAVSHANTCTVTGDTTCQSVGVLLNRGDGTFDTQHLTALPGSTPTGLVAALLNPDSLADLIVADTSGNRVIVLDSRGDGTFFTQATYSTVNSPTRLALVDINRDSVLDLVVGGTGSEVSVLLGQSGGTFANQVRLTSNPVDPGTRALGVGDFDRDGYTDLAVLSGSGVQMLWGICR